MASWVEFSAATPELASAIRELVHQYGSGLGYLATVRPDGGPRVHPVAPVIMDDGLYALHAFPPEDNDDEAYLSGRARPVTDRRRIRRLAEAYRAEPRIDWRLYEFSVEVAMIARRPNGGGPAATVTQIWRDERVRQSSDGPAMRRGTPIG
jgi:hypothetical protein